MKLSSIKPTLDQLIAHAEMGKALRLLVSFTDQPSIQDSFFRTQALALSARYAYLQDQKIKGVLTLSEYDIEIAKVRDGVLDMLRQEEKPVKGSQSIAVIFILLFVLIAGISWYLHRTYGISEKTQPAKSNTFIKDTTTQDTPSLHTPQKNEGAGKSFHDPVLVKPPPPVVSKPPIDLPIDTTLAPRSSHVEYITVRIIVNECWRGAQVIVDGREVGTMAYVEAEVEVPLKDGQSNIKLVKDKDESPLTRKTLKNHDSLTFNCDKR